MRVNVYSQELTDEVLLVDKTSETGKTYCAVRVMLLSSNALHHNSEDDDRSAVTFWMPKSKERCELMAKTFDRMAELVRSNI